MRCEKVTIDQLQYTSCELNDSLVESLNRQGQTFPLRVKQIEENIYQVIDGNKRASYFKQYAPSTCISVDIINDFTTAGSNYWGNKNHH